MWYVISSEINTTAIPYPQVFQKVLLRTSSRKEAYKYFNVCIDKATDSGYGAYEIWENDNVCTCVMRDMEDKTYLYAIKMYKDGIY